MVLEKTVRQMAYLEPNRGGLASLALARLAAALKVNFNMQAHCWISDSFTRKVAPQTRGPLLALFINTGQRDRCIDFVNFELGIGMPASSQYACALCRYQRV